MTRALVPLLCAAWAVSVVAGVWWLIGAALAAKVPQ